MNAGGVRAIAVPDASLLSPYSRAEGYADAYAVEIDRRVAFEEFVEAFYGTWLFGLERVVLTVAGRPSTRIEARSLARGERERFAAWTVEARRESELLLADDTGRTRSWLMCEPLAGGTRLCFGSAVVPKLHARSGERRLGTVFGALLGFHQHYSRALLRAAVGALG